MRSPLLIGILCVMVVPISSCDQQSTSRKQVSDLSAKIDRLSDQSNSDVGKTTEDVLNLTGKVAESDDKVAQLEARFSEQTQRIVALESENQALKATDSRLLRELATEGSKAAELEAALNDVLDVLKRQEAASQQEIKELEERRRQLAAASAPIRAKIQELAARREDCSARIAKLTGPVHVTLSHGTSTFAAAKVIEATTRERDRIAAPEVRQLKATLLEIDRELQAATAELSALKE